MRRNFFWLVFVLSDLLGIIAGFSLAYTIRTALNPLFVEQFTFELSKAQAVFLPLYLTALLWILIFHQTGLYAPHRHFDLVRMFLQIVKGCAWVFALLTIASFFTLRENYSRSLLAFLLPTSILTITACRGLTVMIVRWLIRKGYVAERVAVLGITEAARRVVQKLKSQHGLVFCGHITTEQQNPPRQSEDVTLLGPMEDIETLIERHELTRIICLDSIQSRERLARLAELCEGKGASLELVPDFFQFIPHRIRLTDIGGMPLLNIRKIGMTRWQRTIKGSLDFTIASVCLGLLSPVLAAIALLIAVESHGGIFYRQLRLGYGRRPFRLYKFRSMCPDADQRRRQFLERNEKDGGLFKIRDDPRTTPIGRFLRRFSLDELPQLYNVLKREMSVVGPRPLPPEDLTTVDLERYGYWFEQRLRVLPGLTGLWQVSGRSELTFEEMVELDIYYLENWSLTLDLEILFKTIAEVARGRGAY